jgi:ribosomal protein L19E
VKAIVLDPDNQFHVDRQLTKDDVQKLIKASYILFFKENFNKTFYSQNLAMC